MRSELDDGWLPDGWLPTPAAKMTASIQSFLSISPTDKSAPFGLERAPHNCYLRAAYTP